MTKKEEIKIIIVLSLLCLALFFASGHNRWLLAISIFLAFSELLGGRLPYLIAVGWKNFALALGKLNSKVILFIAFYVFLTPIALIYRLFNKIAVAHFRNNDRGSLFEDVNKKFDKEVFKRMW